MAFVVGMTTVPNRVEAEKIARGLVDSELAACVQIIPQLTSVYKWQGVTEVADELLLMIKSSDTCTVQIKEFLAMHHSYDTPEVIFCLASDISESYARWIDGSVGNNGTR